MLNVVLLSAVMLSVVATKYTRRTMLARDKHSSLFVLSVSDEEETCSRTFLPGIELNICLKTFFYRRGELPKVTS